MPRKTTKTTTVVQQMNDTDAKMRDDGGKDKNNNSAQRMHRCNRMRNTHNRYEYARKSHCRGSKGT